MDEQSHPVARAARSRRLRQAFATTVVARGAGFLIQLLILPLIARSLGAEHYTVYLVISSLLAWIGLLGFGLLPSLSRSLAAGNGAEATERNLVAAASGIMGAISLCLALLIGGAALLFDLRGVAGAQSIPQDEFRPAFLAAGLLAATLCFTGIAAAIRAGLQQTHVSNLWAIAANLSIAALAVFVAMVRPSLLGFIIATQVPLALAGFGDLALLLWRRRHLRRLPTLRLSETPELARTSWAVWVVQLTAIANVHLSLLIVTWKLGASGAAGYGSVLRLELLLSGMIALILAPMIPAIASAEQLGDNVWLRQACRRVQMGTLAASLAVGLGLALAGPWLISRWLGAGIEVTSPLCAVLGAYFVVWMMQFAQFNLLLGLGQTTGVASIFAVETVLILLVGTALLPQWGATGMAAGLLIGTAASTGWWLPRRIRQVLHMRVPTPSDAHRTT